MKTIWVLIHVCNGMMYSSSHVHSTLSPFPQPPPLPPPNLPSFSPLHDILQSLSPSSTGKSTVWYWTISLLCIPVILLVFFMTYKIQNYCNKCITTNSIEKGDLELVPFYRRSNRVYY